MHCRNHVAQLRHEYPEFKAENTEILVMAPNRPASIAKYVNAHPTPFPILSDPGARVAELYGIEIIHAPFMTVFIGAMFVVDQDGRVRYADYSVPLISRPDDSKPLAVLTGIAP
jgi:thioredoxin-dependent peroxiredoxin